MKDSYRFVVIRRFFDPFEAQLACATLEAADVPVVLQNENFANTAWTDLIAVGGVQLLVPESSVSEAEAILGQSTRVLSEDVAETLPEETPSPALARFVSSCPACDSPDLEFHVPLRRLAAVLSLVSLPLVPPVKRYRCKACGHVFRREKQA